MVTIITAIIILGILGILFGYGLALASKKLEVKIEEKVKDIFETLPKANCGACGYAGCMSFAEAVFEGKAPVNGCIPGGESVAKSISKIMGIKADKTLKKIARVKCRGTLEYCYNKYEYDGIQNCEAIATLPTSYKSCEYGCFMNGSCFEVCKFDAIKWKPNSIPEITDKCVGCGACAAICPNNIIELVTENKNVFIACKNLDKGKMAKDKCKVACIGCGLCARKCPVHAIEIKDNLPIIDYEKCINCGLCASVCPVKPEKAITDELAPRKKVEINDNCIGCTLCARKCPVNAITGERKQKHTIDQDKCVKCQICFNNCKFNAIDLKE